MVFEILAAPETPVAAYSYKDSRILTTSVYATDDTERENPLEINFRYNGKNQVVEATLPDNSSMTYAYDPVGRLTKIMRPYDTYFTSVIRFDYDTNGFMTSLTTPIGGTHTFDYDGKGHLLSHVTPMSREYAYSYDDAGRPLGTLLPSGGTVSVDYDTAGRLSTITIPGRTSTYGYEIKGRLGSVSAGTESVAFTYAGDLPVSITQSGVLGHTTTMAYNNLFEPVSLGYAGATVAYTYDKDGLLTSAGNITLNRSAASGRVNSVTDGAVTTSFTYTGFGEVAEAVTTKGSTELADLTLAYHPETRRIMEKTESLTGGSTAYYRYAYDGLGRLTQVYDAADTVQESYQYDANNRRTVGNGRTYMYDADDRLLAVGGGAAEDIYYEYSEDGYMTARQEGVSRTEYSYTATGQMVSVTHLVYVEEEGQGSWVPDESAPAITYHLDALGRRVAKQVGTTIVEKYLWAGFNTTLLAVYDGSDTLIARFDYGVGRMPVRMTQNGSTYYLAYDQVGSLRGIFNASGNLVHEISYDAWGNILFETAGSGLCVPFGFAGGLQDRDTDLVLFGFRDYEPETGRWTTQDPIKFASGDMNFFEFCVGNPVSLIDRDGLDAYGIFGVPFGSPYPVTDVVTPLALRPDGPRLIGLGMVLAGGTLVSLASPFIGTTVIGGMLNGAATSGIASVILGREGAEVIRNMTLGSIAGGTANAIVSQISSMYGISEDMLSQAQLAAFNTVLSEGLASLLDRITDSVFSPTSGESSDTEFFIGPIPPPPDLPSDAPFDAPTKISM